MYYVAGDKIPFMVSLSAWNFAIGFGAMVPAGHEHALALTPTPVGVLVRLLRPLGLDRGLVANSGGR